MTAAGGVTVLGTVLTPLVRLNRRIAGWPSGFGGEPSVAPVTCSTRLASRKPKANRGRGSMWLVRALDVELRAASRGGASGSGEAAVVGSPVGERVTKGHSLDWVESGRASASV